ncbi:MAG: thiamine phosphate synthase [Armatimonadota bacterium]|nr:thiamine phosphate synthase [Armatimonadota bacterium]MDR7452857.1 thiamine phosphate synthase [Armatimonadota bacterium]MDR7456169.1 thiamine phosphate synthase [Armatimonadota bacterium]MDR7496405.1 thiamine phosphate synthase [Armatimonadota bacterium]MDR7510663.1 thiamine phosphate synthase [Armatimonadota bacterium]
MRFDLSLYVITDRAIGRDRPLEDLVAAAIRGGATMVQLRDKTRPLRDVVATGRRLLAITGPAGVPLIVNDRADVALAIGADGVHVGPDDLPVSDARHLLGPDRIVGASAGTVDEAVRAEADGADYLGVGSVFPTSSKADAGEAIGPEGLARIRAAVSVPIVAIGGITADNAPEAIRAGAQGVAVIAAVFGADDVREAAHRIAEAVRAARE